MSMCMRERMLAVVRGREHDRVPFVQYSDLAGPNAEIWAAIGRENLGLLRWSAVHRVEFPHCRVESDAFERAGRRGQRNTLITPAGQLVEERVFEPAFGTAAIHQHFVREPEDYRVLLAYLRDAVVRDDYDRFRRDLRELGDDGLPMVTLPRTPYQQLWIQWVCLEDLCLHLVDCPEVVEECVAAMAAIQTAAFTVVRRAAAELPIPFVNFGDNITAPTIGEANFRRYCVPFYNRLAETLADTEVPVVVHMDGDLKPLWSAIGESRVRGLDSFTPPPDNDTRVGEAAALWPEMRLLVNFPSSVHLAEPEEIYRQAMLLLEEAGHTGRLQIQISENVPPGVWRRSFPPIIRAIHDFGKP